MSDRPDEPTQDDEGIRLGLGADMPSWTSRIPRAVPTAGSSGNKPLAVERYKTLIAGYIFSTLAPEWESQFERKNASYGEYDSELGPLGEMVEIHRKYKKLKRAFIEKVDTDDWDEKPREIAMDMIGHLYLLMAVIDEEADHGR